MENKYKKLFYASLIIIIILIGFIFWNMSKSTNLNTTNSDKSVTKAQPNEENKKVIKVEIIDNKVHFIVWNAEISNHNENSGYYFMQYYIYDLKKDTFEFKGFINGMPAGLT